jgi:hypothetical protein
MEKKSKGLYWFLFLLSMVGQVLLLMYAGQWSTVALPFVCTFFVKALDII